MRQLCFWFVLALTIHAAFAQPSSEQDIRSSWELRKKLAANSILKNYPVRQIGPAAPGGRVVDIDVNPKNTKEFYVALASGGLFKTTNNGITFTSVFDDQDAIGIGDIALCPTNPEIILVGTGEKNSSRSSYSGSGIYKSTDGGKTWQYSGLGGTHHISRIIFHPTDPNTIWVGAIGALFSHNKERGIYKTVDGGKTWKKTLFINDSTGVIDLAIHPQNPSMLLATSWERTRRAGNFNGAGRGSSIYRSTDGGETWTKAVNGFTQDASIGRIGLGVCRNNPQVVYALTDNLTELPNRAREKRIKKEKQFLHRLKTMTTEEFMQTDDAMIDEIFSLFNVDHKFSATSSKENVKAGKFSPRELAQYLADFQSSPNKVLGAQIFRSDDFGETWQKRNAYDLDGVYFSYGYYFGEISVSPANADHVYILGVPLLKSKDGGVTWHRLDTVKTPREVHVDHHALWIDPNDAAHMLLGNDGGIYQSYDEGATWLHMNSIHAGQFYTVNVDMEKPYNVYGGMQDNGVWKGSSDGMYWKQLFSGDGMFVVPDPNNPMLVYTGYQFGNYFRMEMDKRKSKKISPLHQINEPMMRWNWRAPLIMSKHSNGLYIGSNYVLYSDDKGETWKAVSDDLTKKKKQGNVPFSTISALAESPFKQGLLYVGTDDGNMYVSQNNGLAWTLCRGLPEGKFVSSISPSTHAEATVFVSLNGFRDDDLKTYLYVSKDFGKTWVSLKANLPESVANVILQDPVNPDLIYCGLDNGTWASIDGGRSWHLFNNLLNIPSYDLVVHPRENELVVATHGRGLYIVDVKPLQKIRSHEKKLIFASDLPKVKYSESWGEKKFPWDKTEKPHVTLLYFAARAGVVKIEVLDSSGKVMHTLGHHATAGFNSVSWDLSLNTSVNRFLEKGEYKVKYYLDKHSDTATLEVK